MVGLDLLSTGSSYALGSALVWGTFLFYFKRYFNEYPSTVALVLTSSFGIACYLPVTAYTVWSGTPLFPSAFSLMEIIFTLITILIFSLALLTFYHAVSTGAVSVVSPISKIHPVFIVPIELFLLGTHVSVLQLFGIVLATFAVYLANYSGDGLFVPIRKLATFRPAQFGLLSAVLMALVNVSQRVLLHDIALTPQVWVLIKNGGVALLFVPIAASKWSVDVRGNLGTFLIAGLFIATGEHLVALAYATIPASVAAPLISLQAIIAVILGGLLLGEDHFKIRLLAALVAIFGIAFVTIPQ